MDSCFESIKGNVITLRCECIYYVHFISSFRVSGLGDGDMDKELGIRFTPSQVLVSVCFGRVASRWSDLIETV